jgi:hypothetical protein
VTFGIISVSALHNKELDTLYDSPNVVRVIKSKRLTWTGHVVRMEERIDTYRTSVGKPEGRRPLRRPRHRCGNNIKIGLRVLG